MRWFIVLLIVANVILFFWVQQQSRPLPGSMPLPPPDVGRLRLLSELNEEPAGIGVEPSAPIPVEPVADPVEEEPTIPPAPVVIGELTATVPAVDSVQSPMTADSAPVISDAVLPEVEPAPDSRSVIPLTERLETALAALEPAPLETVAAVDVSVEMAEQSDVQDKEGPSRAVAQVIEIPTTETGPLDPQPAAIVASDELQPQVAGEPEGREEGQEEGQLEKAPGPAEADAASVLCYRVGPFDPEGADKLISELPVSMSLLSDLSEEYSSVDRYYVLIPSLPSRAAGRQKLKELAEAGVTDTWLFPSGEYRNAISLGYFSREGGAKRHAANIVKKGFPAEVREKTTIRERRWLFLKDVDGGTPGSSLPLPEGATVEQKVCP